MNADDQSGAPAGPLAGITVVALEQAIAAPLATRHLADLGARVIKIEQPGLGDTTRHYDTAVLGELGAHFVWLNHGKESAALDLREQADLELLLRILASADVLVSNLAPGALDRLGLAPASIRERFDRLIVVDVSGYGKGGPDDHKRAYDLLIQAESGSCAITGRAGDPVKPGVPIADVGTAMYVYSSVLAALYERERTGSGALIEVAMLDVVAEFLGFALNQVIHTGVEQTPVGMGSPIIAPYGAYRTADDRTAVLGTTSDREWGRLTEMIGRPELAIDPRFRHNSDRVARRDEVDALLGDWCGVRSLDEIRRTADEFGIGNAQLNSVGALAEHPQLAARDRWRTVGTPAGDVPALKPPGLAEGWPIRAGAVPAMGEHTEAVRAEFGELQGRPQE